MADGMQCSTHGHVRCMKHPFAYAQMKDQFSESLDEILKRFSFFQESNSATSEQETTVIDPQMEAVRKQLMQFGISFIDPATLATNNRY